jgi:hypothetical protein
MRLYRFIIALMFIFSLPANPVCAADNTHHLRLQILNPGLEYEYRFLPPFSSLTNVRLGAVGGMGSSILTGRGYAGGRLHVQLGGEESHTWAMLGADHYLAAGEEGLYVLVGIEDRLNKDKMIKRIGSASDFFPDNGGLQLSIPTTYRSVFATVLGLRLGWYLGYEF